LKLIVDIKIVLSKGLVLWEIRHRNWPVIYMYAEVEGSE
jgi:hypothetical protein